jgi:hypothetical protein
VKKRSSFVFFCMLFFVRLGLAQLQIVPNTLGDPHFTSGPCPQIVPPDGALCPQGKTCPAFYNPALLPAGYSSVSYCANVPVGIGFQSPGYTLMTMPLTTQEQQAFLLAAQKVESYVKDNVTVTMEVYKVALLDNKGHNNLFFAGNEYWNPVCAADALLPPFSNQPPLVMQNPDGSYGYQNFPETYTTVLNALQAKNAANQYPMQLINYLPSQSQINVEWPSSFLGWVQNTDVATFQLSNFLVGPSGYFPTGSMPFTLCSSPAAMKMLGFGPSFAVNGHTIDDINSPPYNMNVTLYGTDGAVVIPDLTAIPPKGTFTWMYDSTCPAVVSTQLPKAFFQNTVNLALPKVSCSDPKNCEFPQGADGGRDLIGVFNHEINHVLGLMQSQYFKVPGEENSLSYTYGSALFLLDLFDLDSDSVVSGYGSSGIQGYSDFTAAPRNHDPNEPRTIYFGYPASGFTPFVQFGHHDHVMVYDVINGVPQYFPFMNNTLGNPDGDIQTQFGILYADQVGNVQQLVFEDPNLANLPTNNVPHTNVQGGFVPKGIIMVDTVREYSELSANGWNVDYSTLTDPYSTVSPLLTWYQTCFNANGVFTTAENAKCKFSVTPSALKGIQ